MCTKQEYLQLDDGHCDLQTSLIFATVISDMSRAPGLICPGNASLPQIRSDNTNMHMKINQCNTTIISFSL